MMIFLLVLLTLLMPSVAQAQASDEWCYIYLTRYASDDIHIKEGKLIPNGIKTVGGRLDVRLDNQYPDHADSYEFSVYNPTGKRFYVTVKTRVFGGSAQTHRVLIDHWNQHLVTVPATNRDVNTVRLRLRTPVKLVLNGIVVYGDDENPYHPVNLCEKPL